ncbi:MAG: Gfo/Idh/MocA family oxidoreductase [Planctomycetota bacterium]
MAKKNNVNWLLVGTGDIAEKRVAPALSAARNSGITALCDVSRNRAEEMAKAYGVSEVYTDFDKALAETSANAVYLATPIFLHSAHTIKALEAGKHVLVEKPLALNAKDAEEAVEAAKSKNLKAGCSYFRRFTPRYVHTQKMIDENVFGMIVLVRMTYFSWFNPEKDDPKYWRVVKAKSGGGPLSDMGSHMFDVLIGLLGMPKKVYAKAKTLVQPYEVEDSSVILMEYENGADVVATFNWNSKTWSHEFEIIGTEAKVKWHPYDSGPIVQTIGRNIKQIDAPGAENVHLPLVEDFVDAVLQDRNPIVTLQEAAKTNILLDAVYKSTETKQEIVI